MSKEDKDIDQLFSDAAHAEQAPQYDAAYWSEMNAVLNDRDARKKAFIFWTLGGSIVFAILVLSLFGINPTEENNKHRYAQEKQNLNIEKTVNSKKQNNFNQLNSNKENTVQHKKSKVNSNDKNDISSMNDRQAFVANGNNKSLVAERKQTLNQSSKNVLDTQLTNKTEFDSKDEVEKLALRSDDKIQNKSSKIDESVKRETKSLVAPLKIDLPFKKRERLPENEVESIAFIKDVFEAIPQFSIYTKLSGGLMENYKTSRPYESGVVNLSINFEGNFNNLLLRTGIGSQMTNNADLVVSQRAKVYGFSVTNHQNDLSYQSLFDVYIPLELGYKHKKTSFGIGAQANYLFSSTMNLSHYKNHILVSEEKYFGKKEGLNAFSTQGYLWLEHEVFSRLSLGLKVGTNISGRIEDGSYFNNSATTNPIYGQFSIKYNLLKWTK